MALLQRPSEAVAPPIDSEVPLPSFGLPFEQLALANANVLIGEEGRWEAMKHCAEPGIHPLDF
jgi:hypothetical protein